MLSNLAPLYRLIVAELIVLLSKKAIATIEELKSKKEEE